MDAQTQIEYGNLHAFDESAGDATDWQHSAARGVVASLQDNTDIAAILETMDDTARVEFVVGIADIIRVAEEMDGEAAGTDNQDVAVAPTDG